MQGLGSIIDIDIDFVGPDKTLKDLDLGFRVWVLNQISGFGGAGLGSGF